MQFVFSQCRASNPVWRSGAALREELAASEDTQAEEQRQTSGKFYELARIIHALGGSERVLVVSPLRSMLDDVRTEMSKLGVPLAILRGGAVEHAARLADGGVLYGWVRYGHRRAHRDRR